MSNNERDSDRNSGETLLRIYLKHPDKFIGVDPESPVLAPNKDESKPSLSKIQGLADRPQSGDANRNASAPGKVPLTKDYAVRTTYRRKENTKSAALRSLSPLSSSESSDSDVTKWLTAGSCGSARQVEKVQRRKTAEARTPSALLMVERKANSTTTSFASSSTNDGTRRRCVNKSMQRTSPPVVSRRDTTRRQNESATAISRKNAEITKQVPVPKIRSTSAIEKTVNSVIPCIGTRDRSDAGSMTEDSKKEELVILKKEQRDMKTSDSDSDESKVSVVRTKGNKSSAHAVEEPSSKLEANVTRRRGSVNICLAAGEQCKLVRQTHSQLSKPSWRPRQPPFK